MPDPIVAPDASAGSSPAPEASAPAATPALDLDALNETELQAWRMTGEVPRTSPVTDAPAASSPAEAVQDQPASTDAPAQAASEPADTDPDYKPKTAKRIQELLARAERAEAALRSAPPPPARVAPAASTPAPAAVVAPVKPDPETFPYGTADPGYVEALTEFKVAETLAKERATWTERQRQAQVQDESRRVITAFDAKAAAARTKHPDFDAVALLAPTEIPQGSVADLVVLEDEAGAEILYHLQQPANAAERRRILALGPREQFKELVLLGHRLTTDPAVARSTAVPPPPPTLSTRPTPTDPVERAWAMGDSDEATGAIIAAENARELARLKR